MKEENPEKEKELSPTRKKQKQKESWLLASTALNSLMAVVKLIVGYATNTNVIIADGIHSISDVVGSVLIYASIKLAGKKSRRFPMGLHKLEDLAALAGGIAIFYAGYQIIRQVIIQQHSMVPEHVSITIPFLFVILFVQASFAYFEMLSSKKLNSPGVNTDLLNWLGDLGTTVIAIIGIVLSYYRVPYAQKIAVIVIVLIIFHEAYGIVKDAVFTLLDASVDSAIINRARLIIESHPQVENVETLFIRKAGSIYIADIVLQLKEKNMARAHEIVENIEEDLRESIENLEVVTIHYEPVKKKTRRRAVLLTENREIAQRLRDVAFIRMEEMDENGNIIHTVEYQNPFFEEGKGHSMRLISWLMKRDVDEVIFNPTRMNMDKLELFRSLGMEIQTSLNRESYGDSDNRQKTTR